jgi:HTH-like domain
MAGGRGGRGHRPLELTHDSNAEDTWGAARIAAYLRQRWQLRVAPSTVQRARRRAGLATRRQRLRVRGRTPATLFWGAASA